MMYGNYLSFLKGAGGLMQAPGQAIVCQSLLQNVLDGGVDVHGLIGSRSSRGRLCLLSLSIGHNFLLSAKAPVRLERLQDHVPQCCVVLKLLEGELDQHTLNDKFARRMSRTHLVKQRCSILWQNAAGLRTRQT